MAIEIHTIKTAADRPTFVFLHKGLGCAAMWRDLPARVSRATGCNTMVYSRAGYGGSGPCALPRPVDFMQREARDTLPELLVALSIERPYLVGHSDGASIALIAAADGVVVPRAVAAIAPHVFVEPRTVACIATLPEQMRGPLAGKLTRYHGASTASMVRGWVDVWLRDEFLDWDIRPLLPRIECPTAVVQCEDDPYGTVAQVAAITAAVAGPVTELVLHGASHAPHITAPDDVVPVLVALHRGLANS